MIDSSSKARITYFMTAIPEPNCLRQFGAPAWEIDWDRLANALLAGDLSGLTKAQRQALRRLARSKPIVDLATAMNVDPLSIAVALLAETTQNRMAQRLGRRMLKDAPAPLLTIARSHAVLGTP